MIDQETTYPGVRRLAYFLSTVGIYVALAAIVLALGDGYPTLAGAGVLAAIVGGIILVVQRFRNQGAPGWWALGYLVPILNLYLGIRAIAYPEGYSDHKKFDTAAKVIIGLYVGIFLLGIVAAIALPAYQSYVDAAQTGIQ